MISHEKCFPQWGKQLTKQLRNKTSTYAEDCFSNLAFLNTYIINVLFQRVTCQFIKNDNIYIRNFQKSNFKYLYKIKILKICININFNVSIQKYIEILS